MDSVVKRAEDSQLTTKRRAGRVGGCLVPDVHRAMHPIPRDHALDGAFRMALDGAWRIETDHVGLLGDQFV